MRTLAVLVVAALLPTGCLTDKDDPPEAGQTEAEQTEIEQAAAQPAGTDAAQDPAAEAQVVATTPEGTLIDPITLLPVPGSAPQPKPLPGDQPLVPHIYVSLQNQGEGRPVSAIFAIDAARDATPSDDPAIRLTPEEGSCNPQSMQFYIFPEADAERPVVTDADAAQGLSAANLPSVMAVIVTERMLAQGLAESREDTRALNICTRKLWEQLVLTENEQGAASGQ